MSFHGFDHDNPFSDANIAPYQPAQAWQLEYEEWLADTARDRQVRDESGQGAGPFHIHNDGVWRTISECPVCSNMGRS